MFWHQNQGSSIWGSRDIKRFRPRHTYVRTYVQKSAKKISFFGVFRNQGVMKRGEMQKKFCRFLDRLPYFPFYRTIIVLNVKVKIWTIFVFYSENYATFFAKICNFKFLQKIFEVIVVPLDVPDQHPNFSIYLLKHPV